MIARTLAGIIGLLAFLGMLVAGFMAGNTFSTIILRALLGLCAGAGAGFIAGRIAQLLVNEYLNREIDSDSSESESQSQENQAPAA